MKINSQSPAGALPWVEPVDGIAAFEKAHGSLAANFSALRANSKLFESRVKKTKMLELTSVDDKALPKFSALAGSFTAYATNNPDSKLVRIYADGKWDIDPSVPFSRTDGVISE